MLSTLAFASLGVVVADVINRAIDQSRKKKLSQNLDIDNLKNQEFELIAECELTEQGLLEKVKDVQPKLIEGLQDTFVKQTRLFTLCNLPKEEGGKKQYILIFKGDQKEGVDPKNLDLEFTPKSHNFALTPDQLKVVKLKEKPNQRVKYEISFPGTLHDHKYFLVVKNLDNHDQQKLVEWLNSRASGEQDADMKGDQSEKKESQGEGKEGSEKSDVNEFKRQKREWDYQHSKDSEGGKDKQKDNGEEKTADKEQKEGEKGQSDDNQTPDSKQSDGKPLITMTALSPNKVTVKESGEGEVGEKQQKKREQGEKRKKEDEENKQNDRDISKAKEIQEGHMPYVG